MSSWEIKYLDDPGTTPPSLPFRCSYCDRMQHQRGRWVHRWEGVPGHFMAVCDNGVGCSAGRVMSLPRVKRWWQR